MADRHTQLGWIHKNRSKPHREVAAGDVLGRMATEWLGNAAELSAWIREAIERVTDEEFRRCCSFVGYEGGSVTIGVADASLVGWMARRWRSRFLTVFHEAPHGRRVTNIRFRYMA